MSEPKRYQLLVEGQLIEVTQEVYAAYYKALRRETYQNEQFQNNGVFSYNALDNGEVVGESMFSDPKSLSMEEDLINKEYLKLLLTCIKELSLDEQNLIRAIYYEKESLRELAQKMNMSKSAIHYRHKQVLEKLKNLMNIP